MAAGLCRGSCSSRRRQGSARPRCWRSGSAASRLRRCARVAWLSLDEGDNDLRRFLTHLVAALQPRTRGSAPRRWRCSRPPRQPPSEAVLASLVNDLDPLARADRCWRSTTTTSSTAPRSTRPSPSCSTTCRRRSPWRSRPAPTRRCRCRGSARAASCVEVRAADLRFTADEASAFLNEVMGLGLEPDHVAALEAAPRGGPPGCSSPACRPRPGRDR